MQLWQMLVVELVSQYHMMMAGSLTITNTQTEVNDYVDGASFSGGTLTLSVGTQSDVTVSLDGRYVKLGHN